MIGNVFFCKDLSKRIKNEVKEEVKNIKDRIGLAVIVVGDDPASSLYVNNKIKACKEVGFFFTLVDLPKDSTKEDLFYAVNSFNDDSKYSGVLIQLPLHKHLQKYEQEIVEIIDVNKDVDAFKRENAGRLFLEKNTDNYLVPCTAAGCIEILKEMNIGLKGKTAVVIGRGHIAGKPIARLLEIENCTVTVCHSYTPIDELKKACLTADIVISAVGKPKFVTADMIKEGAVVIDVGINDINNKLCGDVDTEEVAKKAKYVTPVPGGVGAMTVSMLMKNTLKAYKLIHKGERNECFWKQMKEEINTLNSQF